MNPRRRVTTMTERKKISAERRDEMFAKLRRNILIARLKVTLDKELNRPTTPAQKALAEMKLPPMRSHHR
jgi:ribosome maturation protein Sdo1